MRVRRVLHGLGVLSRCVDYSVSRRLFFHGASDGVLFPRGVWDSGRFIGPLHTLYIQSILCLHPCLHRLFGRSFVFAGKIPSCRLGFANNQRSHRGHLGSLLFPYLVCHLDFADL